MSPSPAFSSTPAFLFALPDAGPPTTSTSVVVRAASPKANRSFLTVSPSVGPAAPGKEMRARPSHSCQFSQSGGARGTLWGVRRITLLVAIAAAALPSLAAAQALHPSLTLASRTPLVVRGAAFHPREAVR